MAAVRPDEPGTGPGREESLEELFLALEGALLNYALRLVRNPQTAEDLVQEAFLRLQSQEEIVREPRSWLYRTVHNLAVNLLRRARPAPTPDGAGEAAIPGMDDDLADTGPLPDEQLARWEGIGLVRLGLKTLDERSRRVVEMKFSENLSYREIATRTGLTEGHVGYLLHHALKSLTGELARAGLLP